MLRNYNRNQLGHLGRKVNLAKQEDITIDADFIYNYIVKYQQENFANNIEEVWYLYLKINRYLEYMLVPISIIFPTKYRADPAISDTMPNSSGGIGASRGGKSSGFGIREGV